MDSQLHHYSTIRSIILCVLLLFYPSFAGANDEFWQSPLAQSNNQANIYSSDTELVRSFTLDSHGIDRDFAGNPIETPSSFAFSQDLNDRSMLTVEYANGYDQKRYMFGYRNNNLSVSYMSGSAQNYFELAGSYTDVDPYLFHGGWHQKMRYNGYAVDYAFKKFGHLQYGQTTIESAGLLDRKAQYVEWSNDRVFTRLTDISRGDESIGNSIDAGFAFGGNKQMAFQSMRLENGRSLDRVRLQLNGKQTRQYWLDFSTHRNPLFRDNDDYQVMFSFKTLLGTKSLVSYAAESDEQPTKTKNKGLGRAIFIGLGAGAAAALSSSGSESNDDNERFTTQRAAAFDVLNDINPTSVRENREYGGWVFINPDGSYSYSSPVRGEAASVTLPNPNLVTPPGGALSASYHTHAAFDPRYDNENFSPTDLDLNRRFNIDGYLATPGGQFKWHNIETDGVVTLGRIAN